MGAESWRGIAFGTDWPAANYVSTYRQPDAIQVALTRAMLENKIGSLKVGKAAEIIVLEKKLYKISPDNISTTKVMLTMMNGNITYKAK